ncbi:STAS domain-containing protein [Streptomyces flavidovirens]|uniref:STAS domain-containing protein n=1 Tax=Streptomyces flavidovirens TaxID=67298 RepID=UPI0036CF48F9
MVADCMARDLPVVVLDLALLDLCNEAGLHALSGAAASTKVIGGIVHLAAPTRQVRNLLTAAKLESLSPSTAQRPVPLIGGE